MIRYAAFISLMFAPGITSAQVTVVPDSVLFDFFQNDHRGRSGGIFTLRQDVQQSDFTSMGFEYSFNPNGYASTFSNVFINLDEGSSWYLVRGGDVFGSRSIEIGNSLSLTSNSTVTDSYLSHSPTHDEPYSEFFLGFSTSKFDTFDRNVYGWVRLRTRHEFFGIEAPFLEWLSFTDTIHRLELLESATAYDASGIVIGSLHAIPEPTASALMLISCGAVLRLRSRQ